MIALDLRGHGESGIRQPDSGSPTSRRLCSRCAARRASRAVLCGHSWGVALAAAALDPDLVAAVVLLDPAVLFPEPLRRQGLETLVPMLEGAARLEALRRYFERMFGRFDPPDLKARITKGLAVAPAHMAAPLMREIMRCDFSDEIAAGHYPLLVIHAKAPADLNRLKQLRPDAMVAEVVASGHYVALVVPEQVNAMLDRFLAILPLMATASSRSDQ